ncbi:MAG: hypothetical protein Q7S73_00320 [bacterium]|nr:hypothetical protein [bacterium]
MKSDLKAIFALITTYTIGNFLLLFNRGMYWDGWDLITLLGEKKYGLLREIYYAQFQRYTEYYILRLLGLTDNPLLISKFLAFASWILAGLFLYGILRKKFSLPINKAFFLSSFFSLIPIYLVKIDLAFAHYFVNNTLFFGAVFLYFLVEKNKNLFIKYTGLIFSWIIFFISFNTESLLVFYGGFLLILFLDRRKELTDKPLFSLIISWLKKDFIFIILPVIFWAIKLMIGKPISGPESYYNEFLPLNTNSLMYSIQNIWQFITYGFFWPIIAPITILDRKIFTGIFLTILGLFYVITKKIFSLNDQGADFSPKQYISFGFFLFILGMIPYLAVGKAPQVFGNGFGMRHALLLPIGSSLIILGAILTMIKDRWQILLQIILLALFSTFTIYNYYWLDMDWYKQQAIIESLRETKYESIKNASTIIFHDNTGINWQNRNVRSAEYFSYVYSAFPKNHSKLVATEEYNPIEQYSFAKMRTEFPLNFNPLKNVIKIDIISKATSEIPTISNWLSIKKSEIFSDNSVFLEKIKNIYKIETVPRS